MMKVRCDLAIDESARIRIAVGAVVRAVFHVAGPAPGDIDRLIVGDDQHARVVSFVVGNHAGVKPALTTPVFAELRRVG
jgi:hypothetical protein